MAAIIEEEEEEEKEGSRGGRQALTKTSLGHNCLFCANGSGGLVGKGMYLCFVCVYLNI